MCFAGWCASKGWFWNQCLVQARVDRPYELIGACRIQCDTQCARCALGWGLWLRSSRFGDKRVA